MRKVFFTLLLLLFSCSSLFAQNIPEWDAAKIKLQLEKLNTLGNVLYLAAHPDDENTQLLAYLTNEKHYRTAYLSLTRGDGGQNLVGDEQGAYIGLIRTEELLAARRNDGAEQFFSRALDFGYSKTAKETLAFWGHQRILSDVVWRIRKFRPDVIICRFPADKRAGHGNHWASAILAHEAFKIAADSTKFPEQLKYVKPWQPKRILWNTYQFGSINTTSPEQFHLNIGGYNALLGAGYGEIAAEGRSMHKSQGFGTAPSYGNKIAYFKTINGSKPRHSLMDGVPTTWSRVKGGEVVANLISKALEQYDVDHPEATIPLLLKIRSAIKNISNIYWKKQKINDVNQLILACSGIYLSASTDFPYSVSGQTITVQTKAVNRSETPIILKSVSLLDKEIPLDIKLKEKDLQKGKYTVSIPGDTPISQPYWLRQPHHLGYYEIPNQKLVGLPKNPPSLIAQFHLKILGDSLTVSLPVEYSHVDPVRGKVEDPLVVAPPVTANISDEVYIFTSKKAKKIAVKLKSFKKNIRGTAHLKVPDNFKVENNNQPFALINKGDEQLLYFSIAPKKEITSSSSDTMMVELKVKEKTYKRGLKIIDYGYIPTITVFPPSQAKVVAMPLHTSGHDIGYIMGSGDKVPEALEQMGYRVKPLKVSNISGKKLNQLDAVVVGIRAYNTHENLKYKQQNLMDYVKQGGTLVVQYNKNHNLVLKDMGPYPFQVTRNRVTNEHSDVKFLLPGSPVLNTPNKISKADFKGWIQERGLYFVDKVDPHYRQPLAMHDMGEAPLDGSLIVCDYGKGKFVYTSLSFFRELPAGVPGAFRLFANLVAK